MVALMQLCGDKADDDAGHRGADRRSKRDDQAEHSHGAATLLYGEGEHEHRHGHGHEYAGARRC